jgi:hypothetical protein
MIQKSLAISMTFMEAQAGIEPANGGFADLCLTAWLLRRSAYHAVTMRGNQDDKHLPSYHGQRGMSTRFYANSCL